MGSLQSRQPDSAVSGDGDGRSGALARRALNTPSAPAAMGRQLRNGLPLLPIQPQGAPVDLELVNSLRDELP